MASMVFISICSNAYSSLSKKVQFSRLRDGTFGPPGGGPAVDSALVQKLACGPQEVLSAEHPSVLRPAQGLGLRPGGDVTEPLGLLVLVHQAVHLHDGVFDEAQRPHQLLVLFRAS